MYKYRDNYEGFIGYVAAILMALDRLANAVLLGHPDDTLCARWRAHKRECEQKTLIKRI